MKVAPKPIAWRSGFCGAVGREVAGWLYRCRMPADFRALGTSYPRAEQNRVGNWRCLHKWKREESKCCRTSGAPPPMVGAALLQRALRVTQEVGESLSEWRRPCLSWLALVTLKVEVALLPFSP